MYNYSVPKNRSILTFDYSWKAFLSLSYKKIKNWISWFESKQNL